MQLKFGHLSVAYASLNQSIPNDMDYFPESADNGERFFYFAFPRVKLIFPLDQIEVYFRRAQGYYSVLCKILAEKESVFKNLSRGLGTNLEAKGFGWSMMNKNGSGYVLDKDHRPLISILDTESLGEREIWLGSCGAISRKLDSFENFDREMRQLEEITNITINTILLSPKISKKIKTIPDHCIFINS